LVVLLGLVGLTGLIVAGCGDSADAPPRATRTTPERPATTPAEVGNPVDTSAPTRQALALGRRLDAIAATYAPVSMRVNYLVAAETLRSDALSGSVTDEVMAERAGAVRVEIQRMRPLVARARAKVAVGIVVTPVERRVRDELITALDQRTRALVLLERVLDSQADPRVGDSQRAFETTAWLDAWGRSIAAARAATTAAQDLRGTAGLDPAPEEALR